MTTLVLTVVGDDRAGLVAAVAEIVQSHGGNWERSQLAELSGAFAGVIEVSVSAERAGDLHSALVGLEGALTVAVHRGDSAPAVGAERELTLQVLGNDHPGIVREISAALGAHGISIERMTTETRDAAMSGGRLFEATIAVRLPASADLDVVTAEIERLAAEIHVDVSVGQG